MIPHLCPDLPAAQKEALKYGVKVPLVYTSVALTNWTAFKKLGISGASSPGMYHTRRAAGDAHRDRRLQPDAVVARRSDSRAHDADAVQARAARARSAPRRSRRSADDAVLRPSSGISATSWRGCWAAAGSIRRATSTRSPSIAGRTATPTSTTRSGIRTGPRASRRARSAASRSAAITIANSDAARGRIHRRRDRSGVSRRQRVDCSESDVGELEQEVRRPGGERCHAAIAPQKQPQRHGETEKTSKGETLASEIRDAT